MVSHIYTSTYQQIREKKLIPLRDPLSSLANSTCRRVLKQVLYLLYPRWPNQFLSRQTFFTLARDNSYAKRNAKHRI